MFTCLDVKRKLIRFCLMYDDNKGKFEEVRVKV